LTLTPDAAFTSHMRTTALGPALFLALIASACSMVRVPVADPVIDTWPVGEAIECADPRCMEEIRVALAGLDVRDPGHAAVVSARLHREGTVFDPGTGNQILMTRSGACCKVLVAELADGTTSAIGVGYPGISREAIAIPWEVLPGG
jgi:hypothetical protein